MLPGDRCKKHPGGVQRPAGAAGIRPRGCSDRVIKEEGNEDAEKCRHFAARQQSAVPLRHRLLFAGSIRLCGLAQGSRADLLADPAAGCDQLRRQPVSELFCLAGNPYFISLDELVKEGALTAEECKKAKFGRKADDIDYSQLYKERGRLLRLAYSRSDIGHNAEFAAFCEQNKWWLDDFALFMAVKDRFEGKPWIEWAEDIRLRWQNAWTTTAGNCILRWSTTNISSSIRPAVACTKGLRQRKGHPHHRRYPIYVALDSADAWANPQMFQLDEDNIPTAVAGVPPDGFSPTGQLWGNPLYRWEKHRETGYQWWITRLWYCFELYDVVRIDHFRGFDEYFFHSLRQ